MLDMYSLAAIPPPHHNPRTLKRQIQPNFFTAVIVCHATCKRRRQSREYYDGSKRPIQNLEKLYCLASASKFGMQIQNYHATLNFEL